MAYFRIFFGNLRRSGRLGTSGCIQIITYQYRLTILYRSQSPGNWVSSRTRRLFSATFAVEILRYAQSALELLQLDFAPVIADRGHDVEGHGQCAPAILQLNQRPGAALHRI
jgi:hypothetical protein